MNTLTTITVLPLVGLFALAPVSVSAQSIVHHAGSGDLTFFYDSSADAFDVVFRSKFSTVADGLTDEYAGPPGGVGAPGSGQTDWNFTSLTASVSGAPRMTVNGIDYYVSPVSLEDAAEAPDLGLRRRFRELDGEDSVDQFVNFNMTLNWDESDAPEESEFSLFNFDGEGNPIVRYETAAEHFSEDWSVWGHDHWHWGFSEQGEYSLVFDFQGEFANGTFSDVGTTTLDFTVVPEPSTVALLMGLGAVGAVSLWRMRRRVDESKGTA